MKNKRIKSKIFYYNLWKDRGGFIRVIEAFIAVLLIMGVVLFVINRGHVGEEDISSRVYDSQVAALRKIELSDSLRNVILSVPNESLPLKGEEIPSEIKAALDISSLDYLNCSANICSLDEICSMNFYVDENVYVQSVPISANLNLYGPRQLRLFCWLK
jgi:hypothetical protein